ncbi:MAG: DUF3604 domain-containing protein [Chloroflexota bacterium]
MTYHIYWGDTHHNTYQHYNQDPPLDTVLDFASTHLDFYTGAYYTQVFLEVPPKESVRQGAAIKMEGGHPVEILSAGNQIWTGVRFEGPKDLTKLAEEWAEFQDVTRAWNRPDEFIAFAGYEWQGNSRWGDFNVTYREEGPPVYMVDTLPELYGYLRKLRKSGNDAIAIPHHTAYSVGQRAPTWSTCDESLSPYAEVYSIHGCSETDEELIGLRSNPHMGPGVGGGTYVEALDLGLHMGAICSTDNWSNMPGHWGQGIMACLATELTRDGLWEAFRARRVYGVTGDRIQLNFTCNGEPMGSILPHTSERNIEVSVVGCDAIDRIELLRNNRVIATHCHQGTWDLPQPGQTSRYKVRIEPGWGPHPGELPLPEQVWQGALSVNGGRLIDWEPCWVTRGQGVPQLRDNEAQFAMVSHQSYVTKPSQGATVFTFEASPDDEVLVQMKNLHLRQSAIDMATRSHLLWSEADSAAYLAAMTDGDPVRAAASDVYYHMAGKVKVHRAIPEAGYTAKLTLTDDEPMDGEVQYRVRVEQRNGQRAWSSPIWVKSVEFI